MIPKIIHFIFGLTPDFGGKPFSYIHYLAVKTAKIVHEPKIIYLHYQYEPSGIWWDQTKSMVSIKHFVAKDNIFGNRLSHFAHKADVARLEILQEYGGIYMDLDVISINPFEPLLKYEFVMGREENVGLCNAVILTNKDSTFLKLWYESYKNFDENKWNEHSVKLPLQIAKNNSKLIHIENEYSFFFPKINDPVSDYLWNDRLYINKKIIFLSILNKIKKKIMNLHKGINLLSIFHSLLSSKWHYQKLEKSFCLHLWESDWWDKYLVYITEDYIKSDQANFSKLIRKILDDFKL